MLHMKSLLLLLNVWDCELSCDCISSNKHAEALLKLSMLQLVMQIVAAMQLVLHCRATCTAGQTYLPTT
jgi:hypothetical protein